MITLLGKNLSKIKLKNKYSFEDIRHIIYKLKAPHPQNLHILIIDYYISNNADKKSKNVSIPYKGKSLPSEDQDTFNIIYNFNNFPEELQNIICLYIENITE